MAWLLSLSLGARADLYDDVERLLRNQQFDKAQQAITQRLQQAPQDPQMRLLASRLQDARGQTEKALDELESLTREFPELPEPQGRLQEALASLQRAVQARPDYAVALENLGDLYLGLALHAYEQARQSPNPPPSAARKAEALAPWLPR